MTKKKNSYYFYINKKLKHVRISSGDYDKLCSGSKKKTFCENK